MYIFVYDDQYIVVKLPNHLKKCRPESWNKYTVYGIIKSTLYKPKIQHNIFNVWGNKTMENYKNTGLEPHLLHQTWTSWSSWWQYLNNNNHQQRLATSRGLQPAEACDQQRLATSSVLWPTETGESWHRQLIDTGLQLSRQPIQYSHLSYQNTSISLLNEDISSPNKRTASRTESCLLAIMSYNSQKILPAETFF